MATQFEYSLSPSSVICGQQTTLTLTIANPSTKPKVTFNPGRTGSQILVTLPTDYNTAVANASNILISAVDFTATVRSANLAAGLQNLASNTFVIYSTSTVDLLPNTSFSVVLGPFTPNSVAGSSTIQIAEYLGTPDATTTLSLSRDE